MQYFKLFFLGGNVSARFLINGLLINGLYGNSFECCHQVSQIYF